MVSCHHLEILSFFFELVFVSEVRWDTGGCLVAEELSTVCGQKQASLIHWFLRLGSAFVCQHNILFCNLGFKAVNGRSATQLLIVPLSPFSVKRCFLLERKARTNLESILESRDITLPTKVHLVNAVFFSGHVCVRLGP